MQGACGNVARTQDQLLPTRTWAPWQEGQVFIQYAILHRGVSEFIWTAMLKAGWVGCVWEERWAEGY